MKKKVLLVTIQDFKNFGNRLQNYALTHIVEGIGYDVENLTVDKDKKKIRDLIISTLSFFGVKKVRTAYSIQKRKDACIAFSDKYIGRRLFLPQNKLEKMDYDSFCAAITGSDQVWHNWGRIKNELAFFYLSFFPGKRIAYAPSFGFDSFPQQDVSEHQKGLLQMNALSCRERSGCELIKEITGNETQMVLDPTLLLLRNEWEAIEQKPTFNVPDNYALLFILGKATPEYDEEITNIVDKYKLSILNISNTHDTLHYALSPSEFIWLIHHASIVFTDSFHASVFSVIFSTRMRVFVRVSSRHGGMFSRMKDLLEPLGLLENVYSIGEHIDTELNEGATKYLQNKRAESINYLVQSLQTN